MRTQLIHVLLFCTALAAGCKPAPEQPQPIVETQAVPHEETQAHPERPYIPPPRDGVFVKVISESDSPQFLSLTEGQKSALMPTNAERGFGFKVPLGTQVTSQHQHFAVRSLNLNLNMLQITAFKGIAVTPKPWAAPITNENVAWLPTEVIPAQVKIIADEYGLAEIIVSQPLPPGFYVIHDDSMIRAADAEEVAAFYPIVVTHPKDNLHVWAADADRCFAEIFNTYGTDICRTAPQAPDKSKIHACAMSQRLAFRAHHLNLTTLTESAPERTAEEASDAAKKSSKSRKKQTKSTKTPQSSILPPADEYKVRIAYLERLSDPNNAKNHKMMLDLLDHAQCRTAHDLWKIEQHDHLIRLTKLYQLLSQGEKVPPELYQAIIDYYIPSAQPSSPVTKMVPNAPSAPSATPEPADAPLADMAQIPTPPEVAPGASAPESPAIKSSTSTPVDVLAWVPFTHIDPEDPALRDFFEMLVFDRNGSLRLVELLGAIHYRHLMDAAQKTRRLSEWFKLADVGVPESFRILAKTMQFHMSHAELSLGPYLFTAIPEPLQSPWRATFMNQYNAVQACFEQVKHQQPGVFILEQPVDQNNMGQEITGILRDPLDSMRPKPILDPGVAHCILRSFGRIPTTPALMPKQYVRMAITVGVKPPVSELPSP